VGRRRPLRKKKELVKGFHNAGGMGRKKEKRKEDGGENKRNRWAERMSIIQNTARIRRAYHFSPLLNR
jgi:hypothetical protein